MPTGLTPTLIVNRAIQIIGDNQPAVTGSYPTFDTSAAGVAASTLYDGVVQTVARKFGWDFSRNMAALVLTGNTAPVGYSYEYIYPANGIEVRQLVPTAIADPNNPMPYSWVVGNAGVSGVPTKVIWTNLQNAVATFTNQPPPGLWDAGFTESVVRLLASELAMALAGKPDVSDDQMEAFGTFEQAGEMADG